jgi:hypothetical protein
VPACLLLSFRKQYVLYLFNNNNGCYNTIMVINNGNNYNNDCYLCKVVVHQQLCSCCRTFSWVDWEGDCQLQIGRS